MGWVTQNRLLRGETPAQWAKHEYTIENERHRATVLDAVAVRGTIYAAIRQQEKETGRDYVYAAVILFFNSSKRGFGWKEMTECGGAVEAECPARIMRLLSPVADIPNPGYPADWRARVAERRWERAATRAKMEGLRPGMWLRTPRALHFRRGRQADVFEVVPTPARRRGPFFIAVGQSFLCRLRHEDILATERVEAS